MPKRQKVSYRTGAERDLWYNKWPQEKDMETVNGIRHFKDERDYIENFAMNAMVVV